MTENRPRTVREAVLAALASAALASAATTHAADLAAPPSEADRPKDRDDTPAQARTGEALEEIVVRGVALKYRPDEQNSATGIAMKLVDTPQAISVISSNMLEVIGAQSIYDATDLVPGVNRIGEGFGYQKIMSRGVLNNFERINGLQVNGLNLPIEGFAADRVEVVRGPATALYGVTGSFGGEINTELKRPSSTPSLQFGFEGGSFNTTRYTIDGTSAIPGTDDALTARIAAKYEEYSPPVDLAVGNPKKNKSMILASLMWKFSDTTRATVWWYHNDRNADPYDGGALFLTGPKTLSLNTDINPGTWYFSNPKQSIDKTNLDALLGELVHEFSNDWELKAQSLYTKYSEHISYFYPFGPFGAYGNPPDQAAIYTYDISRHSSILTTDLSLGGKFEVFGRKQGFFVGLEDVDPRKPTQFSLLNSLSTGLIRADQGGQGVYADGSPYAPVDRSTLGTRSEALSTDKDFKASVELLVDPVDRVKLLLGVLYDRTSSDYEVPFNGGAPVVPPNVQSTAASKVVKRAGIVFDLVDHAGAIDALKTYFNYSEGFQPQVLLDAAGNPQSLPRVMKQYEAGLKGEFLNGAIGSSIAVYNYDITNIPVDNTLIGSFGNFGNVKAEGKQKATGVEADLVGELLPGWNISANYAYTSTQIEDPGFTFTTPVYMVPKNKGTIASSYEFLAGGLKGLRIGGEATASSDYAFVSGLPNVQRWGQLVAGSYTRFDLNASYHGFSGRWSGLELYANAHNLFNKPIFFSKEGSPSFGVVLSDQRAYVAGFRFLIK